MTSTPIADGLDTPDTPDLSGRPLREVPAEFVDNDDNDTGSSGDGPVQDFMVTLIDGQQALILAQHKYLHDSNIGALAAAQHGFIGVQAKVLERLRAFG